MMDTFGVEMKRALLRQWVVAVIEQTWVDIQPDGLATANYLPKHPCVEATLDYDYSQAKPQFVLSTLCPAIVYFSGTVFKVEGAAVFYRKDVAGGVTDLIVGLGD